MQLRILAVGTRMPPWVRAGVDDYCKRLPRTLSPQILELAHAKRGAEGERLLARLRSGDYVVALDERGRQCDTAEFAAWLARRMQQGRDLCFLIGGPDGLASTVLARADEKLALSRMTLPHAIARLLLTEQLYRAHTIMSGHPYHRA